MDEIEQLALDRGKRIAELEAERDALREAAVELVESRVKEVEYSQAGKEPTVRYTGYIDPTIVDKLKAALNSGEGMR